MSRAWLPSPYIIWSKLDTPLELLVDFLEHVVLTNSKNSHDLGVKLIDINKEECLNNLCKEIKGLKTSVLFSIDDDVCACSSVELAFSLRLTPNTMVEFVPCMHRLNKSEL